MLIVTCNVNGLRSAHGKGFTAWLARQEPDVACLREIGARASDHGPMPVRKAHAAP